MKSKIVYTEIYGTDTTAEIKKNGDVIFSERRGEQIVDMHVGGLAMVGLVAMLAENATSNPKNKIKTMTALRDAANDVLVETDHNPSLPEDFTESPDVRTAQHVERMGIRRQINKAGHEFFESLGSTDVNLMYLSGALMAANEDYVLNHSGKRETNGTLAILKTGFHTNQKRMLERLRDRLQQEM